MLAEKYRGEFLSAFHYRLFTFVLPTSAYRLDNSRTYYYQLTTYEYVMYENKKQPLASKQVFYRRVFKNLFFAFIILTLCLLIGILGYHYIGHVVWIDAIHNASMILSGMGPVVTVENTGGKLFSSAYALFSGVVFITNIGFILAPAAHRLFHRLHLDESRNEGDNDNFSK